MNTARESIKIAHVGNHNSEYGGLYWHETVLHRTDDGRWYTQEYGGAAMMVDRTRRWLTRDEAVDFVSDRATDPVTGYGYTRDQAEIMVDGGDAGKGYRE